MKILVVSDSHRRVANLFTAAEQTEPDMIFHLGDLISDAEQLADAYPQYRVIRVAGNCDLWNVGFDAPGTVEMAAGGARFMLTHGHLYGAKQGTGALLAEGRKRKVDAVLFGHTHVPLAERQEDGMWLVNPGTAGGSGNAATCAVIEVRDGKIVSAEIKKI